MSLIMAVVGKLLNKNTSGKDERFTNYKQLKKGSKNDKK